MEQISLLKNIFFATLFLVAGFALGVSLSHHVKNESRRQGMQHEMDNMLAGLTGKTGEEFDHAFLDEMILHHEGATAMAEEVLKKSKRPELRKLAEDIIRAQKKEIEMMREWGQTWFGHTHH